MVFLTQTWTLPYMPDTYYTLMCFSLNGQLFVESDTSVTLNRTHMTTLSPACTGSPCPSTPHKRTYLQYIRTHADMHNVTHAHSCAQVCCGVYAPITKHMYRIHTSTSEYAVLICKPQTPLQTRTRHTPQLGLTLLAGLNCFVVFLGLLFWGLSWQATGKVYKPPPVSGDQ